MFRAKEILFHFVLYVIFGSFLLFGTWITFGLIRGDLPNDVLYEILPYSVIVAYSGITAWNLIRISVYIYREGDDLIGDKLARKAFVLYVIFGSILWFVTWNGLSLLSRTNSALITWASISAVVVIAGITVLNNAVFNSRFHGFDPPEI